MSISLNEVWIVWGALTAVLVFLVMYRSLVSNKEEDQLFLNTENPAETHMEAEQRAIVMRLNKLGLYIKSLSFACGAILVFIAAIWIYRGINGFTNPSLEP
jgi:hypothetical protein